MVGEQPLTGILWAIRVVPYLALVTPLTTARVRVLVEGRLNEDRNSFAPNFPVKLKKRNGHDSPCPAIVPAIPQDEAVPKPIHLSRG